MTDLTPASPPPLGHLAAALSGRADVASLTQVLTVTLADILPPGMVEVSYKRSTGDRLAGRPGTPTSLTVIAGDKVLRLDSAGHGVAQASVEHAVRGVVISRKPVSITEWITALADELKRLGEADDAARLALERLLLG